MYSGNAAEETPQKYQLRLRISDVQAGSVDIHSLGASEVSGSEQCLHVPILEFNQHSKITGEERGDTSYLQLDIEEATATFSPAQLSKIFFFYGSWRNEPTPLSQQVPPLSASAQQSIHLLVTNMTVTRSSSEQFTLLSLVLGGVAGEIIKDSADKLCHVIPVLNGPLETQNWNTVGSYKSEANSDLLSPQERLVEFFVATPTEKFEGVCLCVCLSPYHSVLVVYR